MKTAYLLAGITTRRLFMIVRQNSFTLYPKYILRFLFLFQSSIWTSFFAWKDKVQHWKKIANHPVPDDPIIIIGHWRTGSTFLHQLLHCDQKLAAPTLFQTSQPWGFRSAYRYFRPIMKLFLSKKRPFDQVASSVDDPQEDEFALVRCTCFSPLIKLIFPKKGEPFFHRPEDYLPPIEKLPYWVDQIRHFYRKVSWINGGKRLILKNPFHSMRVELLARLFPKAHFIHIVRDPLSVVPSTVRMWTNVGRQNCMNRHWTDPGIGSVSEMLNSMLNKVRTDLDKLPPERWSEIRFEDLEKDPIASLRSLYPKIGLPFSSEYKKSLDTFLGTLNGYQKSNYYLSEEEKNIICSITKNHIEAYGYSVPENMAV